MLAVVFDVFAFLRAMQHFFHVFLCFSAELALFLVDLRSLLLVLLSQRRDFFLEFVLVAHEVVQTVDFVGQFADFGEQCVALAGESAHDLAGLLVELQVHELHVLFVRVHVLFDLRVEGFEVFALAADGLLLFDEFFGVFLFVFLVDADGLV